MTASATVLLVDDEPTVRRAMARLIRAAGFEPLLADSGESGLEVLARAKPAAVLLDLNMPGLGGLETLTRAVALAPDTPIIVVSGSGAIDDVVEAVHRGAWDYVMKPIIDAEMLLQPLRRGLEKADLVHQLRTQRTSLVRLNEQLTDAIAELRSDQEAGRRIQFQLLPTDGLHVEGYALTRRLYPSRYLSGDFVDYFVLDAEHLGLYIADVSGHGAASALITAMMVTLIGRYREALTREENDVLLRPGELMTALNRELGLYKLKKHVTMFYGVLDFRTHYLEYTSAGQYPFPLLDDGRHVGPLECAGRPLGLFSSARFFTREISLASTRRMLLASDGVLEVLPEAPGRTKLDELVKRFAASASIEAMADDIGLVPDEHYRDDVTLLLLERSTDHA
ncbi:MAG TPA: SpoIIE family protein phosphatase [Polyangiaceae bacterium]